MESFEPACIACKTAIFFAVVLVCLLSYTIGEEKGYRLCEKRHTMEHKQ